MDEEELGNAGKKITIDSFFESIRKVEKVADDAVKSSKLNLGKIDVATEEIKKLQQIVTAIQTDIQTLQDNDKIRRNELEDRLLEQQDALQKAQMIARQQELKGEKGDKGDQGEAGAPGQGEDRKNTPKPGGGGGGGFLQGLLGVGSIAAASIFNPLAALIGGNYGGMPVGQQRGEQRDGVTPSNNKVLESANPFARLAGMFSRKKGKVEETGTGDDKKESGGMTPYAFIEQKGLKVTDVEDMFRRMVHVYNPDVQDKNGDYQGIKVSGTFQKKDDLSTEEFINAHPAFKISELKKIAKGRKKGKDKEGETKDGENIEPEKKENKLLDFVKKGGVAGFLGRKIFGKKDEDDKKNKAQEVDASNPEDKDSSYSESFSYKGRLDPQTLEFIPDEGSLPEGVPIEKAQQDVYQSKIKMLEFDFRSDIMQGMTREDAIEKYGPQSNLYRFKENYNNTLEYGGYELDVGKHYDSIKNSLSGGKKKGKGQDSSLKGEKRGIKGVIGGVADALTGGFFNFDKRGNTKLQDFAQGTADTFTGGFFDFDKKGDTKLQDFAQGTADTLTGGFFDFDKKGSNKLQRFQQGVADTLTGGFFDFDKKGNNKLQDFQQGTADTLTGGIFDFDKKGSTKLQRFGQGFMDAMTGNLTDFDRKGGKTVGPTRVATGMLDFVTGNMFDLDKRGGFNLFGRGKKKKEESTEPEIESYSREQELDTNFDVNTGKAYVNGIEVDPMAYAEFKQLPLSEQLDKAGAFVIENRVNKIEPVIESKEKDLSSNIYKEIDNTNEAVSNLVTQNVAQTGNANDQSPVIQVPANEPQVSDAEIKSARPNIPFISVLTDKTRKEMSLTSEGSSEIAGYID